MRLFPLVTTLVALGAMSLPATADVAPAGDLLKDLGMKNAVASRDAHVRLAALQPTANASAAPGGTLPSTANPAEATPPPIEEGQGSKPEFPGNRFTYEADVSSMLSGGNTGLPTDQLPGGVDGSILYKFTRTTRLSANYYQFSATALGEHDNIPVVFQGTTAPLAYVNGYKIGVNATTHLRFQFYSMQQLFTVGGRHHPLIFAPAYLSIRSTIGGLDDADKGPIFANNQILTNVHQRSYENKSLNLAIPLFYGEKYFTSYTGGAIWNMNTNGANQTNHPQYISSAFAQYKPDESTTAFVNFVNAITYFPTEVYPYHVPTFHFGASKVLQKPVFVEFEVSTGGPSNPNYISPSQGRIGLPNLTVPCARTAAGGAPTLTCATLAGNGVAVPIVGAQRFTTFTFIVGIGAAPLVRPF